MFFRENLILVSAVCSLASGIASAEVLNFQFAGVVTGGSLTDVGSPITGSFSYDNTPPPPPDLPPDLPPDFVYVDPNFGPNYGNYSFSMPFHLSANAGGHQITSSGLSVTIFNDYGGNIEDHITISESSPFFVDGISNSGSGGSFGLSLASMYGNTNALASTALPSSFNVAAFDAWRYGWVNSNGTDSGYLLQFSVNSISAVPVPAAAWLFGSGLIGFAGFACKRKVV